MCRVGLQLNPPGPGRRKYNQTNRDILITIDFSPTTTKKKMKEAHLKNIYGEILKDLEYQAVGQRISFQSILFFYKECGCGFGF